MQKQSTQRYVEKEDPNAKHIVTKVSFCIMNVVKSIVGTFQHKQQQNWNTKNQTIIQKDTGMKTCKITEVSCQDEVNIVSKIKEEKKFTVR